MVFAHNIPNYDPEAWRNRDELLRAIVQRQVGVLLPDADLEGEWADYYPVVGSDGRLTGDIAESTDEDIVLVDWEDGRLVADPWSSQAAIWSTSLDHIVDNR